MLSRHRREGPLPRVRTIREPGMLRALCHPTRVAMLEALREPGSAAALGRRLGQPRQRVNYHLKALFEAGLVEKLRTRRQGNFMETIYRAAARAFVVAPEVAWADPRRIEVLRRQHALETLVSIGESLQRDAVALLDRATFEDEQIPTAAVSAETGFASERERGAFLREYLEQTRRLIEKHGARGGAPYRVVMAVHPRVEGSGE